MDRRTGKERGIYVRVKSIGKRKDREDIIKPHNRKRSHRRQCKVRQPPQGLIANAGKSPTRTQEHPPKTIVKGDIFLMTASTVLWLTLAALVISIVAGRKMKINIGIIAIFFAFIIGCFCCGKSVSTVISYFPVRFTFMILSINFFFGFVIHNGTMEGIANRIIYASRKATWLLPYMIFFTALIICGVGGGSVAATVVVAPIGYALATAIGFEPVLVAAAVNLGAVAVSLLPWSSYGVLLSGILQQTFDAEFSYNAGLRVSATMVVVFLISFTLFYFLWRGDKLKRRNCRTLQVEMEKPEPFTSEQKRTLALLLVVLALVILVPIAKMLFPCDLTNWLANYCDIQFLSIAGGIVAVLLKVGDANEVLKRDVPWGLLVMACGVSMLVATATNEGIGPVLASWLSDSIPAGAMHGVISLLASAISTVSDGVNVGVGTMSTMVPALAATTGLSAASLVNAMCMGQAMTSISPLSTGGAQILSLASHLDEDGRQRQYIRQFIIAAFQLVFAAVLSFLGIHLIWH